MNAASDLRNMLNCVDEDDSGVITREEWLKMAERQDVITYFELAEIDIKDAHEFFDAVATLTGCSEISIDAFVEGCMKVKGAATSIDLQVLSFQVKEIRSMLEDLVVL